MLVGIKQYRAPKSMPIAVADQKLKSGIFATTLLERVMVNRVTAVAFAAIARNIELNG